MTSIHVYSEFCVLRCSILLKGIYYEASPKREHAGAEVGGGGRAWPRLNCRVIVARGAVTNGCREKPAKNREFVPAASLRIGTGHGEIRGHQSNDPRGMKVVRGVLGRSVGSSTVGRWLGTLD